MRKSIIALRHLVVGYLTENIVIGELMQQIIMEEFVAPLQKHLRKRSISEEEKEATRQRIAQFEELADPRWWNKRAYNQAMKQIQKFRVPSSEIPDLISQVGMKIWERTDEIKRHRSFTRVDPFNFKKNPNELRPIFTTIVHNVITDTLDEMYRKAPYSGFGLGLTDEEGGDPMNQIEDESDPFADVQIREFMKILINYVSSRLMDEDMKKLFSQWVEAAEFRSGISGVNWKRDVWEATLKVESDKYEKELKSQGLAQSTISKKMREFEKNVMPYHSTKQKWNNSVMPLIMGALDKMGISEELIDKRDLKASERVAIKQYFSMLTDWVITGGVLSKIENDDDFSSPEEMVEKIKEEKKK